MAAPSDDTQNVTLGRRSKFLSRLSKSKSMPSIQAQSIASDWKVRGLSRLLKPKTEPVVYGESMTAGRTFRLLSIHRALDQHEQLACSCHPYKIDKAPPYEALSYVWGDPKPAIEVLCNGQTIVIQSELANALLQLRLRDTPRLIWADAICINQNDVPERNHQVLLMGSIYSLASRVVVWLGAENSQFAEAAFGCVEFIAEAVLQYDRDRGLPHNHQEQHRERWDALRLPEDVFTPAVCESLEHLYIRPWFSRIWCVQEIHLAQDATVLWGEFETSWEEVVLTASWIFDRTIAGRHDVALLGNIRVLKADIMRDRHKDSLLQVLREYRTFEASDPRDRVYGLLNLVSPRAEAEAISVNYDKSIEEVYADTVLMGIRLYSRLTGLAYIEHAEDYDGTTDHRSWAPRWDITEYIMPMGIPEDTCPWNASGASVMNAHESSTIHSTDARGSRTNQLRLQGRVYETVSHVTAIMRCDSPEKFMETNELSGESVINIGREHRSASIHPLVQLWRTALVESTEEKRFERILSIAFTVTAGQWGTEWNYNEGLDDIALLKLHQACSQAVKRLQRSNSAQDADDLPNDADTSQFAYLGFLHCDRRRIFWTENQNFGLGPQCMRPGDIVVVLYGGKTPYILRPKGDNYLFLGNAYIHDIMHGEVLDDPNAKEQTFCLI